MVELQWVNIIAWIVVSLVTGFLLLERRGMLQIIGKLEESYSDFRDNMEESERFFEDKVLKKEIEYIVIPTKSFWDTAKHHEFTVKFLGAVLVAYVSLFGQLNVDKDGNKLMVRKMGVNGKFIA